MTSTDQNDQLFGSATKQMMDMYITPEVQRRQAAGLLPAPLHLLAAQILFTPTGTIVRINQEVKAEAAVGPERQLTPGEPIYMHDLVDVVALEPVEAERDFGHFTLFRTGETWRLIFDFRQNRASAIQLVDKAEQFLLTAQLAKDRELGGPFADNLFSAAELLAKAQLIDSIVDKHAKSHKTIHSSLNRWQALGNARADFVALFNSLARDRGDARYSAESVALPANADEQLATVSLEARHLRERIGFGDLG